MNGHVGYPVLEIPSHSIVLCFSQWIINYNLIQKYFKFILEIPCHKYWVRKYVRKYVGIPNFLTILSTLYKNCFQQAGVPFTMNENALSLAINLSIVPFWFNFVHSKFYRWTQMVLLICRPVKKNIICIRCKVLIKVQ